MWSEFPQTLTQMQGARRYVTLFESPFVDSSLSERENNALRASSLLAVPPLPPEVQPLEGLQGTDLPEANFTQWASYMQDVASGMQKPPYTATDCPNQDIAGVLHRLENLTEVGFCRLCYALGGHCGCSRATHQAPHCYGGQALWVLPQPSYASMASSTVTTASTSMRGVSPTAGPPPGFFARRAPTPMGVSLASQGTSASVCARLSQAMGTWCCRLASRMTLGPPSTSRCLRKSRGMSSHPIPAGGTPPLAGKVCLPSPRLKLLLARVRVWPRGEDNKLESREVTRNRPLIPEQGGTCPLPEDLESEEGFPVKAQWMTSWTSYPQVGRGT